MNHFTSTITIVAVVFTVFVAIVPQEAIACAPAANASSIPNAFSALKNLILPEGKHVVLFGTNEKYNADSSASVLQLIQYKVAEYASQTNQKLPSHQEEVLNANGKVVIKSLLESSATSCASIKKFLRKMKPSFPNITFVGVLCQDGRIDVI